MSIKSSFNKVGNKIVETFRPKKGMVLNVMKANEAIAKLEAENDALKGISNTEDQAEQVQAVTPKIDAAKASRENIVKEANAYLKAHPVKVKQYDAVPSITAMVADAQKAEVLAKAECEAAEKYKKELIHKLRSNPRYMNKISMGDMESPERMLAKMTLLDAEEAFTVAVSKAKTRTPDEINQALFNERERTTSEPVFFCARQGWYIMRNTVGKNSRVFIKPETSGQAIKMTGINSYVALVHRAQGSSTGGNVSTVGNGGGSDLTEAEFLSIISNKPTFEQLARTYYLRENLNVTVDMKSIIPLW
jgi:DNA-directed RNA polymerase subunit F